MYMSLLVMKFISKTSTIMYKQIQSRAFDEFNNWYDVLKFNINSVFRRDPAGYELVAWTRWMFLKSSIHRLSLVTMVAYFCHHLSDNYVDLSVIYVDLSDHYVDLSEKYHHNYWLNILFLYRVNATNCHLLVDLISDKSTSLSDKST